MRTHSRPRQWLVLALFVLAVLPAHACAPSKLADLNVTLDRGVPLLPLAIDGGRALLVLDTGAERTILGTQAARRLGLEGHYAYGHTMQGIGGAVATGEVRPRSLLAGALKLTGYSLLVAPITLPGSNGQPVDGLLGADLLLDFDLELDLAHHRVGFYTPVDCDSPMLPWAESYSSIVAHESLHRHLFFPVRLDGHDMAAFIDTGAGLTTIDLTAATAAGATAAALEHDRVVTVQGPAAAAAGARLHRFARLDIGGEAIAAPHAIVTRLDLDDADMVLGADFLATHRVWLSYGARRIHVAAPG